MKPEVEKAIQAFDDHLVWLAKRRMINQTMLDKLSGALKILAENSEPNTGIEAELNAMTDKALKYKLLIRCTGITEKTLTELIKNHTIDDFENYLDDILSDDAPAIINELSLDMFINVTRFRNLVKEIEIEPVETIIERIKHGTQI